MRTQEADPAGAGDVRGAAVARRRLLGAAGAGLVLAAAALTGCSPEADADAGGGSGSGEPSGDSFTTPAPGTAPRPLWQAPAAAGALGSLDTLAVAGDVVLVSGEPLVGRDLATGKELWSRPRTAVPGARMILGGGRLYLASTAYDGDVVALDPATGEEVWRSRLGGRYAQPRPVGADGERVYVVAGILEKDFSSSRNVIAAIDTRTGKAVWSERRDAGTEEYGIHSAVSGRRLVYTDSRENVTVRDTMSGRQLWTKKIGRSSLDRLVVHDGLVIVPDGRTLRAFALESGAERWSLATDEFSSFNGPAVLDGVLYVSDSTRSLWAVDPASGRRLWRNEALLDSAYPVQFAKVGNTLYGATRFDEDGGVHAYDARDGKLRWTWNDGSGSVEQWYVVSSGRRLAALHARKLSVLPAV
ncbi:PQQ-binding-like beta-propeller repeat protein [Streptomyces sp. t39]|uniref:outer membrane protein assembly factor BamB family protein n=1 Tax=Streptomyces sp. t39 TaxID=1828156 RepID=UPI0021C82E62|nr:PQQ-binding-like beta-propeller repeat protein [Streptomyces sp. t39]